MRLLVGGSMAIALLFGGCFNPKIKSGGFACDPTAAQPCPVGFYCVDNLCVDHPGSGGIGGGGGTGGNGGVDDGSGAVDLATSGGDDLAMSIADMATAPPDLARSPDLAQPAPDLAQPPTSCAHDICSTGSKLKSGCDPCVTQICAQDPTCCSSTWDSICVVEVSGVCGQSCN